MVAEQDAVSLVKTLTATVTVTATATATVRYDCAEVFEHVAVWSVRDAISYLEIDPRAVVKAVGFDAVALLELNCTTRH